MNTENVFHILYLTLFTVVGATLVINIFTIYQESKKLKEQGKTPLMLRNIITVTIAAICEALVVWGILSLYKLIDWTVTDLTIIIMFLTVFFLRNIGAYLGALATWSIFLKTDVKKEKKEILKDKEGAI